VQLFKDRIGSTGHFIRDDNARHWHSVSFGFELEPGQMANAIRHSWLPVMFRSLAHDGLRCSEVGHDQPFAAGRFEVGYS